MKNNIVPFKKIEEKFDHQATRDAVLGEADLLNMEVSIRFYSPDTIGLPETRLQEAVNDCRVIMKKVLESDDNVFMLHSMLLDLDAFIDNAFAHGVISPFATSSVTLNHGKTAYDIHVFQFTHARFIKAILSYPIEV